jgi:hypothetical protein
MVLRALQNSANNQNSQASLTWDALNRVTQSYGAPDVDFETFSSMYDSDPVLQSVIDNFDEHGIQIKTNKDSEQAAPAQAQDAGRNMMKSSALHAVKIGK